MTKRTSVNWIMLIYFFSGACSLIDEVVWVRLLKLTLGNTVYASSIVVSMFMGGLALGALIMSRYSDQVKNHLRLYALLETLVTISALALPFGLKLTDNIYIWFFQTYHPSHTQLLIVQVIISAVILLIPSMLMGSTLPLLGRFVTALEKEAGHLVGKLYALNTLGAAVGCFMAGFVLIRAFGVMGTLYAAAVLNLLVALSGWFLSRHSKLVDQARIKVAEIDSEAVADNRKTDGKFYLLILAFFMSGLVSIGYELIWMRSIVHLLGGFTYVFSAVLTIYLLGNVIGAAIGSRLAKKLKTPAAGFAVTLALLGLCGIFFLPGMIYWTANLLPHFNKILDAIAKLIPAAPFIINPMIQSCFLFLIPAIIMGIGFPIALQAWANHVHKVGRSTGTAYGANTIGAVLGGVITGFILIPRLGAQLSITILGLIVLWIAGFLCLVFLPKKSFKRASLLAVAIIFSVVTTKIPSELFGRVVELNPVLPDSFVLLKLKEGVTTSVSLHKNLQDNSLQLLSSGHGLAGDSYSERGDQKALGHLSVLLNRNAKTVLSVGFGSGETTKCLSQHHLDQIDCVEIAPEVVDIAMQFFNHLNLGDKLNDKINMIFMDAKNYIHLTDNTYDVIANDSIHPRDFAENASLYTKEYFQAAKQHLNKNGIIVSWLPTYNMPASVFSSIIGTAMEVFPHVTLWFLTSHPAPLVLIVCSEQQQYYSPGYMEYVLRDKSIAESLSEINIYNSRDILNCYIGDERDLKKCIQSFSINSDYFPFVEFTTDKNTPRREIYNQFVKNVRSNSINYHIDWTGFSDQEKEKWQEDYSRLYNASTYLLLAYDCEDLVEKLKFCNEGLKILPDMPALIKTGRQVEKQLFSIGVRTIVSGKSDQALGVANAMLEVYPQSAYAWMIRASSINDIREMPKALIAAQSAVKLAPDNPDALTILGSIYFKMGQIAKSIEVYKKSLRINPYQPRILALVTQMLIKDNQTDYYNPSEAVRLAEKACEYTAYKKTNLMETLSLAYAAANRIPEAINTAQKALNLAKAHGDKAAADNIRTRLFLYKAADKAKP